MTSFRKLSPNLIQDDLGSTLQILGRVGIRVVIGAQAFEIDSEMLAIPMGIVIHKDRISPEPGSSASLIVEFACDALQWAGFTVEF